MIKLTHSFLKPGVLAALGVATALAGSAVPLDASAQGRFARGGAIVSDGQGGGAWLRGGCARGVNGDGCQGAATRVRPDGSVTRRGGFAARGANGEIVSGGGFDIAPDGAARGGRSTRARGANGGTYVGDTRFGDGRYDRSGVYIAPDGSRRVVESEWVRDQGGARRVTCYDPSGHVVSCR